MNNSKIIKESNKEQKGGDVMTKEHLITTSIMHKDDYVYEVKIASVPKDMCNGKYTSMIGKITPKKSKEDEVKDVVEEDVQINVQTNTSIDGVIDLVVEHEEQKVEIPLFMEIDRIDRMYARRIEEISNMYARSIEKINRELESLNKKVVYKKRTTQKNLFIHYLTKYSNKTNMLSFYVAPLF